MLSSLYCIDDGLIFEVEMTRSALHIDAILIRLNCCSKSDAAIGTNRSTRMNNQGIHQLQGNKLANSTREQKNKEGKQQNKKKRAIIVYCVKIIEYLGLYELSNTHFMAHVSID